MHMAMHCRAATIQVDLSAEVTFAFDVAEHFERVVQAGASRLRLTFGDRPECDADVGLERIREEHPETNDTTDQVRKRMLAQSACELHGTSQSAPHFDAPHCFDAGAHCL